MRAGLNAAQHATIVRCFEVPEADIVNCHAFNHDESLLALCPNDETVRIYQVQASEFVKTHVLGKHTQKVTGLSWSSAGRVVSVSEDRTAFVWEWDTTSNTWKSVHTELRTPRAALCVQWAPNGERFAVGLSSKDAAVCHWKEEVACWVAKKVGRCKAAVGTVAWHPTSQYLAIGSTDCRCAVYDVNDTGGSYGNAEVVEDVGSWVNSVAFSPKGKYLAFAGQDSSVRLKDLEQGPHAQVKVLRWRQLPFLTLAFADDSSLVACGFDNVPVLFRIVGDDWQVVGSLDAGVKTAPCVAARGSFEGARDIFRTMSGRDGLKQEPAVSSSWHSGAITTCNAVDFGKRHISTSGMDGLVIVWELTV